MKRPIGMTWRFAQLVFALFSMLALTPAALPRSTEPPAKEWRETYAYTLGVQAYVYGFPWVYLPTIRWLWVTQPVDPKTSPYAPVNHFWHARNLVDASYRDGGSPNNDAIYSSAWLDVTHEPIILSVPDMDDRYYTFEIAGMDSDNFAYVGKRTTGSKAILSHYAPEVTFRSFENCLQCCFSGRANQFCLCSCSADRGKELLQVRRRLFGGV